MPRNIQKDNETQKQISKPAKELLGYGGLGMDSKDHLTGRCTGQLCNKANLFPQPTKHLLVNLEKIGLGPHIYSYRFCISGSRFGLCEVRKTSISTRSRLMHVQSVFFNLHKLPFCPPPPLQTFHIFLDVSNPFSKSIVKSIRLQQ